MAPADQATSHDGRSAVVSKSGLAGFLQRFLLIAAGVTCVAIALVGSWGLGWALLLVSLILCVPGALVLPGILQMASANRQDAAGAATWADLVSAWWSETLAACKVYLWWQSFGWKALPDNQAQQRRVEGSAAVFVHGFVCNRGLWRPWMRLLRQRKLPYVTVNLEPLFGSISDYAQLVQSAVERAEQLGEGKPLLVCHSMGGLAVRNWLVSEPSAYERVASVVTIGSPHFGTLIAKGSKTTNGRQMLVGSRWLQSLAQREKELRPSRTYEKFLCWYSNTDNIVFPASTALLDGADNRLIRGIGHLALNYDSTVMNETIALM